MKKQALKRFAAVITLCFALGIVGAVPVTATGYYDVNFGDWYYEDISRLTDMGVFKGYDDGYFRPDRNISCAEFTKVLMMCVGTDMTVPVDRVLFEEHWASGYISAAYSIGIITNDDIRSGFSPDLPITRLQMTKMMVLALGLEPAYNVSSPFSDSTDPYVVAAYRAYLLRGYINAEGNRMAYGSSRATRAEAAAIAVRVLDYVRDPYEYKKNAVLENAENNCLDTEAELMDLFYILNRELVTEFTFSTHFLFSEWHPIYADTKLVHFEYFYSTGCTCTYIPGNNVFTIKLEYSDIMSVLKQRYYDTEAAADLIIAEIIKDGMTDVEKLRAIHDFIVLNCAYDHISYQNGNIPMEAYLAYGALCNKTAVCQGYTNAFSLLCKRVGIPAVTVIGTPPLKNGAHSWNVVLVDGVLYGVDTTFDDPSPDVAGHVDDRYFMMTLDEMTDLGYSWDPAKVKYEYFH